jgi:hypothetical protein
MFRSSTATVIIVALFFVGLYSLANYSYQVSAQEPLPVQAAAATSTAIPFTATPTGSVAENPLLPLPDLTQTQATSDQALIAFIDTPVGSQKEPYVILSAYYSDGISTGTINIQGNIADQSFFCPGNPCRVPVSQSTAISFQALTDSGLTSNIVQANINISGTTDQFTIYIESVTQYIVFTDACSNLWGTSATNLQTWGNYFQIPSRLNTDKKLHILASRLISFGLVDTKDCPNGGLDGTGAPNACGLEKTFPTLVKWQNQYDFNIWAASRDIKIPPKLIKTLIETESQFWPSNERLFLDEIGLGQMNQLGMDVVLKNNPDIYFKLCQTVLGQCNQSYNTLSSELQAMIRGALIESINASCPSCPYGIDLGKARQSIGLMALVIKSNCQQTKALLNNAHATASNEDLWKFTIATYHSGLGCVQNAIEEASVINSEVTWDSVSPKLLCYGGKTYVDNFWNNLATFSNYSLEPGNPLIALTDATVSASQSPLATPTPTTANIHVLVNVYQDINGNGAPDANEWVNNILVQLTLEDGSNLTKMTENGKVDFDMSNYRPGITIIASLPGYYQSKAVTLPSEGQVSVDFVFSNPIIPTKQP